MSMPTEPEPKLKEKDFIQESKQRNPLPLWLIMAIAVGVFALIWSGVNWVSQLTHSKVEESPFLKVTNREMSLFLWQNPEYMRSNVKAKTGYLPGFQSENRITPVLSTVDNYITAPPEVIFLYHHWNQYLGDVVIPRPISKQEFVEFLLVAKEWNPENWPDAPEKYREFVRDLDFLSKDQSHSFPYAILPRKVRIAILGWMNYTLDRDQINQLQPTVGEVKAFLQKYPQYSRNYWRNLYPKYLETLLNKDVDPNQKIPKEEIPPFLRVALFNDQETMTKPSL